MGPRRLPGPRRKVRRPGRPAPADPLEAYATDLVARAADGRQIDPLIGRRLELERMVQVLCRRRKNNPLLVGEPGVGKTALAEGLALAHSPGRSAGGAERREGVCARPGIAARRHALSRRFRGARQAGARAARAKEPNAILFIDEIHSLVGAGAASGGAMDAGNLLKPALASGSLRCIGSTTFSDVKQSFDKDRALSRRFQKIDVLEPSGSETLEILKGFARTTSRITA